MAIEPQVKQRPERKSDLIGAALMIGVAALVLLATFKEPTLSQLAVFSERVGLIPWGFAALRILSAVVFLLDGVAASKGKEWGLLSAIGVMLYLLTGPTDTLLNASRGMFWGSFAVLMSGPLMGLALGAMHARNWPAGWWRQEPHGGGIG